MLQFPLLPSVILDKKIVLHYAVFVQPIEAIWIKMCKLNIFLDGCNIIEMSQ